MTYNIYIDESCHLEKDSSSVMTIGYIKVPLTSYSIIKKCIKDLKLKHNTPVEIKWNKFSNSRLDLYKALVDLFFETPLEFRCVVVKYKDRLKHNDFNQGSHENFYYKLIYFLLRPNGPIQEYQVYLDVINSRGKDRLNKIQEVFNNYYGGDSPFRSFQHLHSENLFFQLADIFVGAITYKNRIINEDLDTIHVGKKEFIEYLEAKSGYLLHEGTEPWVTKFNIFDHQPKMRS